MSETPSAEEPGDPDGAGDSGVPDFAGELDHESRGEPGGDDAGERAAAVGIRGVLSLAVIVVLVGAVALWAVLARGPRSRPAATTTTQAATIGTDPAELFAVSCASCHGAQGKGLPGGGAPVLAGSGVTPEAVAESLIAGAPGMPSFRGRLSDEDIALMAAYVAAIGRAG